MRLDDLIHAKVQEHILHGNFRTSTGPVKEYYDVVSAILHYPSTFRRFYSRGVGRLWPVGTGVSGATIIGLLGRGSIWNPKDYGIEWHNLPPHSRQMGVVLVDDCIFTGRTLNALRAACATRGLIVRKEIVVYDGSST